MNRFNIHPFFAVSASALAILAGGCGSDSHPVDPPPAKASSVSSSSSSASTARPATPTEAGLEKFRGGLVAGQEQIDTTLKSLAELTDPNQTDLRGAFDRYSNNLAQMNEHADTMKREADAMRASRDEYFGKWEEKVTEIDNPTIRKSAEARRTRLRDAHERIITTSSATRDAYGPFMKDLQDIKKFLSSDLSKSSIADISDAAKKVQADGAVVKQKIGEVISTLDSVQNRQ